MGKEMRDMIKKENKLCFQHRMERKTEKSFQLSAGRQWLLAETIRELYGEGQLFYLYKRLFSKVIWSYTDSRNPEPSTNLFVVPLPDSETENRE